MAVFIAKTGHEVIITGVIPNSTKVIIEGVVHNIKAVVDVNELTADDKRTEIYQRIEELTLPSVSEHAE